MKRCIVVLVLLLCLTACAAPAAQVDVAATTAPVYGFTQAICANTDVTVGQIIADSVSCLHDYSLSVRQMELIEKSELVLLSGGGLEDFMSDTLRGTETVDCSEGVSFFEADHGIDAHVWLDPDRAMMMAENICKALSAKYPQHKETFEANAEDLVQKLCDLKTWGQAELSAISSNKLITFHDGFTYLASAFDLEILAAVEAEAGAEASATDLTQIIGMVEEQGIFCVFTETNGSDAAARVIAAETGCRVFALDMAMNTDYFAAMEHNINTLKEALT